MNMPDDTPENSITVMVNHEGKLYAVGQEYDSSSYESSIEGSDMISRALHNQMRKIFNRE